ncbi:MAG TPA: Xaa-Pro peptidase family protein [Candidatus Limnocylindria bacterium]|nr:Xaa-Pro peptidase family protein [Candidatus Limnocylindria bacterium]
MRPMIPDLEFQARAANAQRLMKEQGIDALLAFGSEAEPQFARYFCDYWPSFESCAVLIPREGDPVLLIGPESMAFASDRSRVQEIRRLAAFRESSNPEYPGEQLETIDQVLEGIARGARIKRFAIAGYALIPHVAFTELSASLSRFPGAEVVRGDELVMGLRMVKSESEIACLREAGRITRIAFDHVLGHIRPGMTELQVRGLACAAMYEHGAENEAYPMWMLAGDGGNQAISRARHKVIGKNDMVMLQIGARYEGYASSIGRPVFFGERDSKLVDAVKAGYEAHEAVAGQLYAGNDAGMVAAKYYDVMKRNGHEGWLLYGPCHATGLMEGEPPWIERNSRYPLRENMTYCIDVFMGEPGGKRGFRIEDSVRVGLKRADSMTDYRRDIIIL